MTIGRTRMCGGVVAAALLAACGTSGVDDAAANIVVISDPPIIVPAGDGAAAPRVDTSSTVAPTAGASTSALPTTSAAPLPTSTTVITSTVTTVPPTVGAAPPPTGAAASTTSSPDGDPGPTSGDELADLVTVEPVFEVEPLQPFELDTAASRPAVDDAGNEAPRGWVAFDAALDDALIRNGNTAAAVTVSIGGQVVHAAAFGRRAPLLDADPATTGDRFRIASISKPITAITLLQLVEDGVVGLDEPIGDLVAEELGIAPSAGARRLTVRRLLNHTSGFGKYDAQFFRGASDDCDDAARTGISSGGGGGGYRYSNMNYCVAGVLVEALTGSSYEAAAYRYVLTPLGLSGPRLAATFDPGPGEILHPFTPGRNYMETLAGAGGWIATPTDLVTIMNSLDPTTPGVKLLEPDTLALMKTPVGGQPGQRGYGLGLILYGDNRYGHTGTIEQTHAMVQNRGDGITWSITVAGPYPSNTPQLEAIINRAFVAAGFIAG